MIPSTFVMVDYLPLTPNGKVDYSALPKPSPDDRAVEGTFKDPDTAIEESLVCIWKELLGLERVSTGDNFFDIGGHSLLAMQMIARVHDQFRVDLPIMAVFEDSTIKGLSNRIHMLQKDGKSTNERRKYVNE